MSFDTVKQLENRVAEFFGSPYAVAVDCCTHGVELCLRHQKVGAITVPRRTYISIPFLTAKLDLSLEWRDEDIDTVGYHYYMTPETAQIGLDKLDKAIETTPRQWKVTDWPDVSAMKVFNYESEVDPYLQTR